ncbi:MBL fold metallo-hydrolase [uncultured Microscilla sp.]|uniref:MBL fold metallo-hydrolase n=1 Tax=uncultured Microscilla sp. TaxID=432653 RepID=UPI00262520D6|nr:MBL fold metallo-hydrolase [uncultured Microscilla sp.]
MHTPIRIELPTLFGMNTVNAYLFLKPEPVLIDCGEQTEQSWKTLNKALAAHHLHINDLAKVIVTHAHVDHIGMAGKIAKESNKTEIWVSEYAYNWAANPQGMNEIRQGVIQDYLEFFPQLKGSPLQQMFNSAYKLMATAWGDIPPKKIRKFTKDETLHFGNYEWQVIYAPGHCNHQTCFYQPDTQQLLSADMLLAVTPTPVIDVTLEPPYQREKSLHQMMASYQKFAQLEVSTVYPGHYVPFDNHREVITKQLNRISQRKTECLEHIRAGTHDFMALLEKLYGTNFSIPALPMLVGYLDLLASEDLIKAEKTAQGIKYFAM